MGWPFNETPDIRPVPPHPPPVITQIITPFKTGRIPGVLNRRGIMIMNRRHLASRKKHADMDVRAPWLGLIDRLWSAGILACKIYPPGIEDILPLQTMHSVDASIFIQLV